MRLSWIKVVPKPSVSLEEKGRSIITEMGMYRHKHGEDDMKTEAEVGGMRLQAKDY